MRHVLLALPIAATVAFSLPADAQLPKKPEPKGVTEYSVEGQFSTYKQENVDWGEIKGKSGGAAARALNTSPTGVVIAGEARFAYGKVDYAQATGTETKQNYLFDLRALTGRRIGSAESHFTPFLGIGWWRAESASGGIKWPGDNFTVVDRRTSDYYYMPIGILSRKPRENGGYVELNAEFDYLLRGTTKAEFPQYGLTEKLVHNKGRGYRVSAMFGFGQWAAGPFLSHWTVAKSTAGVVWTEPETKTTEAGVRVRYTFN